MTIQDIIEILNDQPDKEAIFLIPVEDGFVAACVADSGPATDRLGNPVFVAMPCNCHNHEPMIFDVLAEDFDENLN